jgi:hypothetical protein
MNLTGQKVYQKGRRTKHEKPNDKNYLAWLRTQPSALSGGFPCVVAHYRTAKNSGTGIKPLFSAIPLLQSEHEEQHRIGQYNFMPREWWEEMTGIYLRRWIRETGAEMPQ